MTVYIYSSIDNKISPRQIVKATYRWKYLRIHVVFWRAPKIFVLGLFECRNWYDGRTDSEIVRQRIQQIRHQILYVRSSNRPTQTRVKDKLSIRRYSREQRRFSDTIHMIRRLRTNGFGGKQENVARTRSIGKRVFSCPRDDDIRRHGTRWCQSGVVKSTSRRVWEGWEGKQLIHMSART